MKKVALILAAIIVVLLGVLIFVPAKAPEAPPGSVATSTASQSTVSADGHVQVVAPHVNDTIASPVSIMGTVTGGGWFFEASFPVKVVDADGTMLGGGTAQAQPPESWMSTGAVPFAATISFKTPHSATGTVVLSKDNPSGMPQNDMSLTIPVRFASSAIVPSSTVSTGSSGIRGSVALGPTCPVERFPPDPACAPKPYPTKIDIYRPVGSALPYRVIQTDTSAVFNVTLEPGTYFLQPRGGQTFPHCSGTQVEVLIGQFTQTTLNCDTGIR